MIFSYYYYYSPLTLHSIPARYSTLCLTSAILVIYVSKLILLPHPPTPPPLFCLPIFTIFLPEPTLSKYMGSYILLLLHLPRFL